ncbi:hypothetical protein D9M68_912600 [compost metagenome]
MRAAALPGRRFAQRTEHGLQRSQFTGRGFPEQRHQQHALQPVGGQVLQPLPAPPAAMEQAAGFGGQGFQGGGQVLLQGGEGLWIHGGCHWNEARHSTCSARDQLP